MLGLRNCPGNSERHHLLSNEPNAYLEALLGDRAAKLNPFKTYADKGIIQAHGVESLTVRQGLTTVPTGCPLTSRNGAGKIADMVILSGNLYETEKEELDTIKVEKLLLQGEHYKKIGQNPIVQVF